MTMIRLRISALAMGLAATAGLARASASFIPLEELVASRRDNRLVTTSGTVVETFRDEVDPGWHFLVLKDRDAFLPIGVRDQPDIDPNDWLDAEITVTGILYDRNRGARHYSGSYLGASEPASDNIRVVTPAGNAFECEPLDQSRWTSPGDLIRLGRRSARGVVLARWDGDRFALRTKDEDVVIVMLRHGPPPPPGTRVCAVGYPETDVFHPLLVRAVWQEQPNAAVPPLANPIRILPEQLFQNDEGHAQLHYLEHDGKVFTLTGIVRHLAISEAGLRLDLDCQTHVIPVTVDPQAADGLAGLVPGTEIEVTGVFLMEWESWNPNLVMTRIKSCRLFVRAADDIRVLARPPWWTPAKLAVVIGILFLGIVGFAAWSAALRKIVLRRSRELLKEQIAHVRADLRTDERTRLAVELHDALSQNLEGVAFQVAATRDLLDAAPEAARQSLDAADHMLLSSRTELKRCLFDLRHDALEAKSFDEALRTTLTPISGDAELTIRFNVRREFFSDTSVHIVLCIIRELVSNAIRHGKAGHVRIAGEYHDGTLGFSVRDDGTGFDPSGCPGTENGHFGLEGIRERVHRLHGVFSIVSKPGGPTRAVVTCDLGHQSAATTAFSK